tara:strand:+ start:252 stop:1118 length:867 start_codon:yes stop_codon:yes gene_type:complete
VADSIFLNNLQAHVRAVRNKLKDAYCIDADYGCDNIGKKRILRYAEAVSENPSKYYQDVLAPKIQKAINVPVVIYSKEKMSTKWGAHPMGFFLRSKVIGVLDVLPRFYKLKYNTDKGFDKYIRYVLYHEFGHSIDDVLGEISQSKKYRSDVESVSSGGRGATPYFAADTDYGASEVWAEFSAIQDFFKKEINLKDIKNLCYIKHNYKKGNRIAWKEKRRSEILSQAEQAKKAGDLEKFNKLNKLSEEYIITKGDFLIQSEAIQGFLNCSDKEDTLSRLKAIGLRSDKE